MSEQLSAEIRPSNRLLTAAEFHRLADVPPEVEWFANISNAHTRRAYENAVRDFMQFAGVLHRLCQRRVAARTCWHMRDRERRKFRSSIWLKCS
jgi:hypothetical protein